MAAPVSLLEFAQQQQAAAAPALAAAQAAAAQARAALALVRDRRAAAASAGAAFAREAAALRAELAAIVMPADGEPLLEALERTLAAQQANAAEALDAERAERYAAAEAARAEAVLSATARRARAAEAALPGAEADAARRDALRTRLNGAEFSDLRTTADAALNTAPANAALTAADARVSGEFPAALLTRALARLARAQARTTRSGLADVAAAAAAASFGTTHDGTLGQVAIATRALEGAEALAATHAGTAAERLAVATARLAAIPQEPALTAAQVERITDAALDAARTAAADGEAALDVLRDAVDTQRATLAGLLLDAWRVDIDTDPASVPAIVTAQADLAAAEAALAPVEAAWNAPEHARDAAVTLLAERVAALAAAEAAASARGEDPATDPAVIAARVAVTNAGNALDAAEVAWRASPKAVLGVWCATVPDTAWRRLADLEAARATLTQLAGQDPAALATALGAAEDALLAALIAADKAARGGEWLQQEAARDAAREDFENAAFARAVFAGLRAGVAP